MYKSILTACLLVASMSAMAQAPKTSAVDTNKLKANMDVLETASTLISERKDISVADAIPTLRLINQAIQNDLKLLYDERLKSVKAPASITPPVTKH